MLCDHLTFFQREQPDCICRRTPEAGSSINQPDNCPGELDSRSNPPRKVLRFGCRSDKSLAVFLVVAVCVLLNGCFSSDPPLIDKTDLIEIKKPTGAPLEGSFALRNVDSADPTFVKISPLPDKRYIARVWRDSDGVEGGTDYTTQFVSDMPGSVNGKSFRVYTSVASPDGKITFYWQLWVATDTGDLYGRDIDDLLSDDDIRTQAAATAQSLGLVIAKERNNIQLKTVDGTPPSSKQLKALFSAPIFLRAMDTKKTQMSPMDYAITHTLGEMSGGEAVIDLLLSASPDKIGDEKLVQLASVEEQVAMFRERHQGKDSWQSEDSQRRLKDLHWFLKLDGHQRAAYVQSVMLNVQARNLYSAGKYPEAASILTGVSNTIRDTLGEGHPRYAKSLYYLALSNQAMGRYDLAESLLQHALEIYKHSVGEQHPEYALCLGKLAKLNALLGRAGESESQFLDASETIQKQVFGTNQQQISALMGGIFSETWEYLDFLSDVAESKGASSEEFLHRIIPIEEALLQVASESQVQALSLFNGEGSDQSEEEMRKRFQDFIAQFMKGPQSVYASSLQMLAAFYSDKGRFDLAEQNFLKVLEIRKKVLGEEHPRYAETLSSLAHCYFLTGKFDQAENFDREALAIRQRSLGESHPDYAKSLNDLAIVLAATKREIEASRLLLDSAQVEWHTLTRNFPVMSDQQKHEFLSHSGFQQSELLSSLVFQGKGVEAKVGLEGTLISKQLLFEAARQESASLVRAVAAAPPEWKAKWNERERLRHEYATLAVQSLSDAGRPQGHEHAPVDQAHVRALATQIEQMDEELRRTNSDYAQQALVRQVTLDDVAKALRPGEALLEYVSYRPFDFPTNKWEDPHYGVFVLLGGSDEVAAVDLGEAKQIDEAVRQFRQNVSEFIEQWKYNVSVTPSAAQLRKQQSENREGPGVLSETRTALASSALRALVWEPLEKNLTRIKRVYLAPEGALSLVPFEALAHADGSRGWHYLSEDKELIYLGTARDLARLVLNEGNSHSIRTAVLVSNPDFGANQKVLAAVVSKLRRPTATIIEALAASQPASPGVSTLGGGASEENHELPATWNQEAVIRLDQLLTKPVYAQLKRLGWSVTTLSGDNAVEEAVLGVQAPQILQFATHGFFLDSPKADSKIWDNPLLRSGMVMAGVNSWPKGHSLYYRVGNEILGEVQARALKLTDQQLGEAQVRVADGILTAYEATGMNLSGTELVNMTACKTGLGDVTPDGIAGLRQAFLLAGARALTMSTWEVPVKETGEEINDFYDHWLVGTQGRQSTARYRAFRIAQLAALRRARETLGTGHPFYWAGVVYVGDPGDLPSGRGRDAKKTVP